MEQLIDSPRAFVLCVSPDALLADLQNSVPGQPQQPPAHHHYPPLNGGGAQNQNGASPGYGSVRKQAASPTSVSLFKESAIP